MGLPPYFLNIVFNDCNDGNLSDDLLYGSSSVDDNGVYIFAAVEFSEFIFLFPGYDFVYVFGFNR